MTKFKVGDRVRITDKCLFNDQRDTQGTISDIDSHRRNSYVVNYFSHYKHCLELIKPKKKVVKKECLCLNPCMWYGIHRNCPIHAHGPKRPVGRPRKDITGMARITKPTLPQKIDTESSSVAIASTVNELITYLERMKR